MIRTDLGLVLRPAPPTLAQIINGKLWVRLDGSDDDIKRVFGLRKAPGRPKGFACILPADQWPKSYWETTLTCPRDTQYENIYDTLVRVDGVSQIITLSHTDAPNSSTTQVFVTLALNRHYELLQPEFAKVLGVGITVGAGVHKSQDSMNKDSSSIRRWAPLPEDKSSSSVLPAPAVPASSPRKRQSSAELFLQAAKRTYRYVRVRGERALSKSLTKHSVFA